MNVEGIVNNRLYTQEIAKNSDIICIQEHWLYACQIYSCKEILVNHDVAIRFVDDANPIQPWRIPRGMAGVAIARCNEWQKYIKDPFS